MLPTVLPRTGRTPPPMGVAQCRPAELLPRALVERRRKPRPARPLPPAEVRSQPRRDDRGTMLPSRTTVLDDARLARARQAMSHHQVDAVLVVGCDGDAPLLWVTRDGLVRQSEPGASRQGPLQAISDIVAHLHAETTLAQMRELIREPDISRVMIWNTKGPVAILSADELFNMTAADPSASVGSARLRRAPARPHASAVPTLAGHGRRLLGLVARAQPDADGWTSEAQLEAMVPGGRLEWRVGALEALAAAGLLTRVQRDGQFDYRLTPRGLEVADAHAAVGSNDRRQPLRRN
jgi:hypothetical protein